MTGNYYVYVHVFPNGMRYVGITNNNPEVRWRGGRGYKSNHRMFTDILLYGWLNIEHRILFTGLTEEEASIKEKELIGEYKTDNIEHGYNVQTGGVEGFTHTKEAREKISKASKAMWADPEKRQKLIDIQKEAQARPEIKKRKAEYAKNRYHNDPEYRERFIKAARERMNDPVIKEEFRQKSIERWHDEAFKKMMHDRMAGENNPSARAVDQYTINGEYIKTYATGKEAAQEIGIPRSCISACLKGKQETAGGFIWRYACGEKRNIKSQVLSI